MSSPENRDYKEFSLFRERLYEIIFEADTPAGKLFDILLLFAILGSVIIVMLETVPSLEHHHGLFYGLEWVFTIFFTIEYITRLYTVHSPKKYATSFFGIVDLVSIIPTYLTFFFGDAIASLMVFRAIRLLRVFRIFKLGNFLFEGQIIIKALKESRDKILVFMFFILVMVTIFGTVIYFVETSSTLGNKENFTSIPKSVYWAIVTLSTVGYGDIYPTSPLGQFLSSILMVLAYAVIAVPTGIVTAQFSKGQKKKKAKKLTTQVCSFCLKDGHEDDSVYCKFCGGHLHLSGVVEEKEKKKKKKN